MARALVLWIHWSLFGAALCEAGALVGVALLRLHLAYAMGALTRGTLLQALGFFVLVLSFLWGAGWVLVTRPREETRRNDPWREPG